MENRDFFKNQVRKNISGVRLCDNKISKDYPNLMSELYYRQLLLSNNFTDWEAKNSLRWIEGYANYINLYTNMKNGQHKDSFFNEWEIVRVDFFGNLKKEMEFDHPALIYKVLKEDGLLLVIPMTSKTITYLTASQDSNIENLFSLKKGIPSLGNLLKDSTLLLDRMRIISKDRVIKQYSMESWDNREKKMKTGRQKIKHKETRKLISKKVAKFYGNDYLDLLEVEYQGKIDSLEEMLIGEKEKVRELEENILNLQTQLQAVLEVAASVEEKKNC